MKIVAFIPGALNAMQAVAENVIINRIVVGSSCAEVV